MSRCYVICAKRTAVVPRGGAFNHLQADELAASVFEVLLRDCSLEKNSVDQVIMGNALYGGGNPARVAALRAGLDLKTPAMTIDTQCCSGMDAVKYGAALIQSSAANVVIAGGMESYSRSPIRSMRPMSFDEEAIPYHRPPFTPWADNDPDMIVSAGDLSVLENCTREMQEQHAVTSHEKALSATLLGRKEIVPIENVLEDSFARQLTPKLLNRLPALYGEAPYELTSATIAVEADAAAALLLVSEEIYRKLDCPALVVEHSVSVGTDPALPAISPLTAIQCCLKDVGLNVSQIDVFEVMEAFAVQGVLMERYLGEDASKKMNVTGGALARGHPIGASGAVNLIKLFHQMIDMPVRSRGIGAIAAAGGLGSATLLTVL